ncbi:hypothetical protein MMC16_006891 [Acarospora aff. strigata]|nr:hypothetical protein [Acarospora aff. strigata]
MGVDVPFDPTHRFATSWLLPPWLLFSVRLLISIYAFTTTFFIIGWNGTHHRLDASRASFSYFTNLTYWGLAFYFLFAAIHTFSHARTGTPLLSRWPRSLQALHSLFYTTIITFPILVTVVFWAILYSGPWFPVTFNAWTNVRLLPLANSVKNSPLIRSNIIIQTSQHALNSLFALLEILLPRTAPPPFLHLPFLILLLALYLALAYITHATQGFYPYGFLDPSAGRSGRVAAYAFAILAAVVVIFLVVWALVWVRKWATERVGGSGRRTKRRREYGGRARVEEGVVEDVEMRGYMTK